MIASQQALQEPVSVLKRWKRACGSPGGESSTLSARLESSKAQIAEQQTEMLPLTIQLASANIKMRNSARR
ncbi:hypothetical protein [Duncaniella dubosii]|uniref:hypothetical protein n=1 Tax=Duncaniella dubosii TaxID=2518971 RepID=UPI003F673A16